MLIRAPAGEVQIVLLASISGLDQVAPPRKPSVLRAPTRMDLGNGACRNLGVIAAVARHAVFWRDVRSGHLEPVEL